MDHLTTKKREKDTMEKNTPADTRPVGGLDQEHHEAARHDLSAKSYQFLMAQLLDWGYLTTADIENRSARYGDIMDDNYHGRFSTTDEELREYVWEFSELSTLPEHLRCHVNVDVVGIVEDMAHNDEILVIVEPIAMFDSRSEHGVWDRTSPACLHIFKHCASFE